MVVGFKLSLFSLLLLMLDWLIVFHLLDLIPSCQDGACDCNKINFHFGNDLLAPILCCFVLNSFSNCCIIALCIAGNNNIG